MSEAVFDAASDLIVACDRADIIQFLNPGAERPFRYLSVETVSRPDKIKRSRACASLCTPTMRCGF